MSRAFQLKSYLSHWLNSVDEHSIHSPFFFDLYQKVVNVRHQEIDRIEDIRKNLLANNELIDYTDLGSPSTHFNSNRRPISRVASTSLAPVRWNAFYLRLARYMNARRIVELGTSMGISTLYLAEANSARIFTFEGNPSIINIALTHFEALGADNIELIQGNINDTLDAFLDDTSKIDFALIDANHQYLPTVQYVNKIIRRISPKGIILIDDIHQSPEMHKAWKELTGHDLVYGSVDLFKCGIIFFDPSLNKQNFVWSL